MRFYCEKCGKLYDVAGHDYMCECGGMFRLKTDEADEFKKSVSIGEGITPLLDFRTNNQDYLLKMESLQPTGSFKDRGAYYMINELYNRGIKKIALDSSGNAGAAVAAYATAAKMDCTVYVPDDTSKEKLDQMEAYGAKFVKVPNGRMRACAAAKMNLGDAYYASHVYNPLFMEGMKSMAHEIYAQLGNDVPEYVFMPVGNGTMLIGLYEGFKEIGRLPHLVAVQSRKCAPVYEEYYGLPAAQKKTTVASAIRIEEPRRIEWIKEALKESEGDVVMVDDTDILKAKKHLGGRGIYVETTAAAGMAGALEYFKGGKPDNYRIIVAITGHGLKR
ncbi:MAG: pyridoxal-phosphate dependent enzyme [Selenomonadaceae bacterium]|nr:pyridoxal-phosphate dependent enzyme [Selenomonadaceae bacterium]